MEFLKIPKSTFHRGCIQSMNDNCLPEDMSLDSVEPTPQDWGFPAKPNRANQECWDHQETFLEAYKLTSRATHAAKAAGVSIQAVDQWLSRDVYSFKKRMELARRVYCDSIRQIIHDRISNPQGNRGSDVLVMFEAKAAMPELYREEVKVVGMDASKQMLDKLRELASKHLQRQEAQKALEAPAVEGIYKEVPPPGTEASPPPAESSPPRTEAPPTQPPSRMPPKESSSPMAAKDRRAAQFRAGRAARARTPGRMVRR
jgi:hypothetical protein